MEHTQLTPEELDAHVANGTLRLAFVSMSNGGKSYRSKVLEKECGFMWYHVDHEIQKALGFETMEEISEWLGYPSSPDYDERVATYLRLENTYTNVRNLDTEGKNLVFDTTGSVVHLEEETLAWLKAYCLIVHLNVDESTLAMMVERFFEHPKPVVWENHFDRKDGETENEALRRCYPRLLAERMDQYRALAHVNINAMDFYDKSGPETLEIIKAHL